MLPGVGGADGAGISLDGGRCGEGEAEEDDINLGWCVVAPVM